MPPDLLPDADKAELEALPAELQQIADGAVAWFAAAEPPRCPHHDGLLEGGEAFWVPEIAYDCNVGPDHRCVPVLGGGPAGYYDSSYWSDNPVWVAIGFQKTEPHLTHYNFTAITDLDTSVCVFKAEAVVDLDQDAEFTHYELSGVVDENGVVFEPIVITEEEWNG